VEVDPVTSLAVDGQTTDGDQEGEKGSTCGAKVHILADSEIDPFLSTVKWDRIALVSR